MAMFAGWSDEALDLLEQAEADDSWSARQLRRDRHEAYVRGPMVALCDQLSGEFGAPHVWNLHRDPDLWRQQIAQLELADRVELRVRLSLTGLEVWGGMRRPAPAQLAAYRTAVVDDHSGRQLARAVHRLLGAEGPAPWQLAGDALKTQPRGIDPHHPRLDLLRRIDLVLRREWPIGAWLASREPLSRVRAAWREVAPVTDWLRVHLGPDPRRR